MAKSLIQQEIPAVCFRKETYLNLGMLSRAYPMVPELSRLVFKENALEKPTQHFFNQLSHYLATIIDPETASKLTWPLYDSKAERTYRTELNNFICDNSSKGLTPVMSSYFVNPSCYKVTVLIFQMSSLALITLISNLGNDTQKQLIDEVNETYKKESDKDTFVAFVEKKTQDIQSKLSNHITKRRIYEEIAKKLCQKILESEKKVSDAQTFINELVDDFIKMHNLDDISKEKILCMKNVNVTSLAFCDDWLMYTDSEIKNLNVQWERAIQLLMMCKETADLTKDVVMRYTGQLEKSMYMITYNPKTDKIKTKDLESQVNVEQAFVLKNLEVDRKLNFPNLIKAFVISISFIMKNIFVDHQIFKFNEYLEAGRLSFHEVALGLRSVLERISNAEEKLEYIAPTLNSTLSYGNGHIYPGNLTGPSLANLKAGKDFQAFFDTFTPLAASKQRFNLYRSLNNFKQPLIKTLQPPKDDFTRSIISYNINPHYEMSLNSNNLSVISQVKSNETIADCASGFTKQQIQRLLSTKKTSSSKKYKNSCERPNNIKVGALTYDSGVSIESTVLTRSYSSPNLYENREKRSIPRTRGRKLSIMKEDSPFELSGISALENNSNFSTPGPANAESSRKFSLTPKVIVSNYDFDLKGNLSKESNAERKSLENSTNDTPKTNPCLIKKTSSIEKIINRFKKVRASVIPPRDDLIMEQRETIIGEKETQPISRPMLPDLLSPSMSLSEVSGNSLDENQYRSPRESLGAVLGVDQTFLDQFNIID